MRKKRKLEHIENYLKTEYVGDNLFDDVFLEHNSLPDLNFEEIDTEIEFLGKKLAFPLMINSMTGGPEISLEINKNLATLTKEFGIAMAVGSEKIALEEEETSESFTVVREVLGDEGVVIGNLSANSTLEEVIKARDLINADAIQLHLNSAQELVMEAGDRHFKGILGNIEKINREVNFPIIVKETGFGISRSCAEKLYASGIRYIDLAGAGGTNFIEIEDLRRPDEDFSDIYCWGNPTAYLLHTYKGMEKDLTIISSGGLREAMDIVKSLVMGAGICGISGEVLNYLLRGDYEYAQKYLESLIYKTKIIMVLLGTRNIKELMGYKYKVTGRLKDMI